MEIKVLGAHNCQSDSTSLPGFLIDGVLALDGGTIASGLSFEAQQQLKAVLLTHRHYDHTREIPALTMNFWLRGTRLTVFSIPDVHDTLTTHLLNGTVYPSFAQRPGREPALDLRVIEPLQAQDIGGYSVLAVPMHHGAPAVGYQVTSADGKSLFYTGDTGPGLADCWPHISPQLLIIEATASDRYMEAAIKVGHLTPSLLEKELVGFQEAKGYLPQILVAHISPHLEAETAAEIAAVAARLGTTITLAHEGMLIKL